MNRKEILKREYEQKRAAGGFDVPATPRPQDFRRLPVRGRWKRRVFGFLFLAVVVAVCWLTEPWRHIVTDDRIIGDVARMPESGSGTSANLPVPAPMDDETFAKVLNANASYFQPNESEYDQLCEYVRKAPCVSANPRYSEIMSGVCYLINTNTEINAFATFGTRQNGDKAERVRVIKFTTGSWLFCRLASLAVAAGLGGDKGAVMRFVSSLEMRDYSNMDGECVVKLMRKSRLEQAFADPEVCKKAKSIAAGMVIGILAHEVGHHVLGHVDGLGGGKPKNNEIDRNQEREADSFASSVISSSPFGEYVFAGTLLWHYALANKQQERGSVEDTHPLSLERLENLIRANPDKAKEMGIVLKK